MIMTQSSQMRDPQSVIEQILQCVPEDWEGRNDLEISLNNAVKGPEGEPEYKEFFKPPEVRTAEAFNRIARVLTEKLEDPEHSQLEWILGIVEIIQGRPCKP